MSGCLFGLNRSSKHRRAALIASMAVIALGFGCRSEEAAVAEPSDPLKLFGVNLASGSFGGGSIPGTYGTDYRYSPESDFEYFAGKGLPLVRLAFRWERLQRSLNAPLDETEMARIDDVISFARNHGVHVILDAHNYFKYNGVRIGTEEVPYSAFADFWRRMAERYMDEPAVCAYGIMNEPNKTEGRWPTAAQAAVDAIRAVDTKTTILVGGDSWSGAHSWIKSNADLWIEDSFNNIVYEAHQYFDADSSGSYSKSYDESGAHPDIGVERLQPFIQWLKEHNARGFIGEFGVPNDDPRWLVVLDRFMAECEANGIGGVYWAAGPWWGSYSLSVQPLNGEDRPQMAVLEKYGQGVQTPQEPAGQASGARE